MSVATNHDEDGRARPDFDELFNTMKPVLTARLAGRFRCDTRTAAEVAVETLEEFWFRPGAFDPALGMAEAWLTRCAFNRMRMRRRSRKRSREVALVPERLVARESPDPADVHAAECARGEIWCAALGLPRLERWAVMGRFRRGMTVTELMAAGRKTRSQVDHLLRRGLARLERRLRPARSGLRALQIPCESGPAPAYYSRTAPE